jgi:hypothetical protein
MSRARVSKMRRLLLITAIIGCAAGLAGVGATTNAVAGVAQCHNTDRTIPKQIRFARGRTTAVIKDTVRLCTMHEYRLRASAGQKITAHLATGKRTSMTLLSPHGEPVFDGTWDFEGELPDSGQYLLQIGTDVTAAYTLEVTIR